MLAPGRACHAPASSLPLSREGGDEGGPHEGAEYRLGSCDESIQSRCGSVASVSGRCSCDYAEIKILVPFERIIRLFYAGPNPINKS